MWAFVRTCLSPVRSVNSSRSLRRATTSTSERLAGGEGDYEWLVFTGKAFGRYWRERSAGGESVEQASDFRLWEANGIDNDHDIEPRARAPKLSGKTRVT